jgi:hypothetical protein
VKKIKSRPIGAKGSWQNPRPVGGPQITALQLEKFGRAVLMILDQSPDWGPDTLEQIGAAAQQLGLVSEHNTPVFASVLQQRAKP